MMARYLQLIDGVPRMRDVVITLPAIYDESITIASLTVTGTPITLPASQTYTNSELEVYLNGVRQEDTYDYTFIGAAPRTQIGFTFDLVNGDVVRFRIDRTQ